MRLYKLFLVLSFEIFCSAYSSQPVPRKASRATLPQQTKSLSSPAQPIHQGPGDFHTANPMNSVNQAQKAGMQSQPGTGFAVISEKPGNSIPSVRSFANLNQRIKTAYTKTVQPQLQDLKNNLALLGDKVSVKGSNFWDQSKSYYGKWWVNPKLASTRNSLALLGDKIGVKASNLYAKAKDYSTDKYRTFIQPKLNSARDSVGLGADKLETRVSNSYAIAKGYSTQ